MASTETGQMYTFDEFANLSREERKFVVPLSAEQEAIIAPMNRTERRKWLRTNMKQELRKAKNERSSTPKS